MPLLVSPLTFSLSAETANLIQNNEADKSTRWEEMLELVCALCNNEMSVEIKPKHEDPKA